MKLTAWGDAPYTILDIRNATDSTRLGSVHAARPGHEGADAKDATLALYAHWQTGRAAA